MTQRRSAPRHCNRDGGFSSQADVAQSKKKDLERRLMPFLLESSKGEDKFTSRLVSVTCGLIENTMGKVKNLGFRNLCGAWFLGNKIFQDSSLSSGFENKRDSRLVVFTEFNGFTSRKKQAIRSLMRSSLTCSGWRGSQ